MKLLGLAASVPVALVLVVLTAALHGTATSVADVASALEPGVYRWTGAEGVPITIVSSLETTGDPQALLAPDGSVLLVSVRDEVYLLDQVSYVEDVLRSEHLEPAVLDVAALADTSGCCSLRMHVSGGVLTLYCVGGCPLDDCSLQRTGQGSSLTHAHCGCGTGDPPQEECCSGALDLNAQGQLEFDCGGTCPTDPVDCSIYLVVHGPEPQSTTWLCLCEGG